MNFLKTAFSNMFFFSKMDLFKTGCFKHGVFNFCFSKMETARLIFFLLHKEVDCHATMARSGQL
jgi:hypothetical protein